MPVSKDAVVWGYRLFRGKEPESESMIQPMMQCNDLFELARLLVHSVEFVKPGRQDLVLEKKKELIYYLRTRQPVMNVSRDTVIWAYRFLLGREPESEAVIDAKMHFDLPTLVQTFVDCREFIEKGRNELLFGGAGIGKNHTEAHGPNQKTMYISHLPESCFLNEGAKRIRGLITFPQNEEDCLQRVKIKCNADRFGVNPSSMSGVQIYLESICNLHVNISNSNQRITMGKRCTGKWVFHLWSSCDVIIGDDVTSNGVDCFLNPGGLLLVGDDCMFANSFIHVGDNHAVFDISTRQLLNFSENPRVILKEHVWVASRVTILSDTTIGRGSVLGVGSVVKGDFPDCTLVAGVPAKAVRTGISWTRSHNGSEMEHVIERLQQSPS